MTRATGSTGARFGRRRLLQAAGGATALAALGQPGFTIGANAQDTLTITMWWSYPGLVDSRTFVTTGCADHLLS
jgi:hypothetical protein